MKADGLIQRMTAGGRICPMPQLWNRLWEMLPDKSRLGGGWEPPLPLILGAWHETTNAEKRERFQEHLCWADAHGVLDKALMLLESAGPNDWLTDE